MATDTSLPPVLLEGEEWVAERDGVGHDVSLSCKKIPTPFSQHPVYGSSSRNTEVGSIG